MKIYDCLIIGSGPAGMQCASTLKQHGKSVALIDENSALGGQIYRNITATNSYLTDILGKEYTAGKPIAKQVQDLEIECYFNATLWNIEKHTFTEKEYAKKSNTKTPQTKNKPDFYYNVFITHKDNSLKLQSTHVVIATGAIERPVPIPGWTSAGTMTAGAAQILLKSSAIASHNAVFIGSGPLLLLIATQYIAAGIPIKAIIDTTPRINTIKSLPYLLSALQQPKMLFKGIKMLLKIKKSPIPYITTAKNIEIVSENNITCGVSYTHKGKTKKINTDCVFLHCGIIPNTNITKALKAEHYWDNSNQCWNVSTSDTGETSRKNIYCIGDGAKISGAVAAEISGERTAYSILFRLYDDNSKQTKTEIQNKIIKLSQEIHKVNTIRPFLNYMYQPGEICKNPADSAIVCRCEEQTCSDVKKAISLGVTGANQLKAFTRCGMGPCQGRYCASTVGFILQKQLKKPMTQIETYTTRPPFKPIKLQQMIIKDDNS